MKSKDETPLEVQAKKVLCLEFVVCISNEVKAEGRPGMGLPGGFQSGAGLPRFRAG